MTRVHIAECESNSVHSCHWPVVNDTNALSVFYTQQSAFVSLTNVHSCHWPLPKEGWLSLSREAPSCIGVIDQWSMTRMHWVWFTPSSVHSCHWPLPKEGWLSLSREALSCICVIDHRSMTRMHCVWFKPSSVHSCHWPMCIRVIDHWVWFTPRCVHSCHWPLLKGPIWTRVGIRVIDHY